jgi:hypothetical protein
VAKSPSAEAAPGARKDTASLPPGTPEPAPRTYSPADLPAAPAVRASSKSARIVPRESVAPAGPGDPGSGPGAAPGAVRDAAPVPAPIVLAAPSSRPLRPQPYGREIVLEVAPESRGSAGQSVADAARRLGGAVERVEREPSDGTPVAVSVLLPESAATSFLSEMERIGRVPPVGRTAGADIPPGPVRGTVAYTVRIRVP